MAKGIPLRESWARWIFGHAFFYDLVIAALAIVPGVVGGWKFLADESTRDVGYFCISVAIVAGIVAIAKVVALWIVKAQEQSVHSLEGCLHALHGILVANHQKGQKDPQLRLTIHVPKGEKELQQLINYVGDQRKPNTVGRVFSVHGGIIGFVYRTRKYSVARRKNENYELYVQELVDTWGYIESDARKLDIYARAWMAVPLFNQLDSNKIEGIVYLDATDSEFFTDNQEKAVLSACAGIAKFVAQCYN